MVHVAQNPNQLLNEMQDQGASLLGISLESEQAPRMLKSLKLIKLTWRNSKIFSVENEPVIMFWLQTGPIKE